ncbi:MAG: hypothetical protein NE327_01970 [Lentisphaeraceae bacterium]|nr:hypothetical protein [Lentisphaeraceae bacterium]
MIRLLIITGFILTLSTYAQEKSDPAAIIKKKPAEAEKKETAEEPKKKIPVKITADHMKYDDTGFIVYFTGNVHVDDGQMKVDSELLTVKLDKNRDPNLIICEKNVVIRKEGTTSYSDRAEYFLPEEKVVLTGKPKVIRVNQKGQKQNMTGSKIIFYRNSNVIESQGVGMEFPSGGLSDDKKKDSEPAKEEKK